MVCVSLWIHDEGRVCFNPAKLVDQFLLRTCSATEVELLDAVVFPFFFRTGSFAKVSGQTKLFSGRFELFRVDRLSLR